MAKFMSMDKKQRIVATLLIIVLAVLVWQVYSLFFATPTEITPPVSKPIAATPAAATPAKPQPANKSAETVSDSSSNDSTDPYQKKYLQLIEEYKILELQKMIATDKQAIAAAQEATVASLNKINQMGGQANLQTLDLTPNNDVNANSTNADFTLVYTGLEDGEWMATLKRGNNSFDVNVGTVLDGKYRVNKIDNNEVILQSKNKIIHISFDGNSTTDIPTKEDSKPNNIATTAETVKQMSSALAKDSTEKPTTEGITQTPALPKAPVKTFTPPPIKPAVVATPTNTHAWYNQAWHDLKNYVDYFSHSNAKTETNKVPITATTTAPAAITPAPVTTATTASTTPATTAKAIIPEIPPLQPKPVSAQTALALSGQPPIASTTIASKPACNIAKYTIQLAMLAEKNQVQQFVQDHHLAADSYSVYQEKTGMHRYAILSGSYATREEANKALRALLPNLKQSGPYIVSMNDIQQKAQAISGNNN